MNVRDIALDILRVAHQYYLKFPNFSVQSSDVQAELSQCTENHLAAALQYLDDKGYVTYTHEPGRKLPFYFFLTTAGLDYFLDNYGKSQTSVKSIAPQNIRQKECNIMDAKESALMILKAGFYAYHQNTKALIEPWLVDKQLKGAVPCDLWIAAYKYLVDCGFINAHYADNSPIPVYFTITDLGLRALSEYIERPDAQPVASNSAEPAQIAERPTLPLAATTEPRITQNFNIYGSHSSIGLNQVVFHNGPSLSDLEALIASRIDLASKEKEDLNALIASLQPIISQKQPAENGFLAQFSEIMEKHSWIASPLASILLEWAFGTKLR